MLFSVVIPLYNKADTIERSLRSIASQTLSDFEVIVVDDGSSDEGSAVVESFDGIQSLRLIHQTNAGVSAARNRGVKEAFGEFVAFLDADDEWDSEFLQELHRILLRYPQANVIGTDYAYVKPNEIIMGLDRDRIEEIDFFDEWAWRTPINSSSAAIRKTFYNECGGYNSAYRFYEDAEFLFRMALETKFHVSRRVLCRYNTDAISRATGSAYELSRYPHWLMSERMIREHVASCGLKRCIMIEFSRALYGYARHLRVAEICKIKDSYPNLFGLVKWWGLLSNRVGLMIAMPLVFGYSLYQRSKIKSKLLIRKRSV